MTTTTTPTPVKADAIDHRDECPRPGYRYAATVRSTDITRELGTAGKVVMMCRGCPATILR